MDSFLKFQDEIRVGKHGKTAKLWMSYMDHISLTLALQEAVQDNNYLLFVYVLYLMAILFFAYNGQNYARHLTFIAMFLANIETSHPGAIQLLKLGAFSVARSFCPGNRAAVDKTMEETFMHHAKSDRMGSGITGIYMNYGSYQCWIRSANARSQYVNVTLKQAGMMDDDARSKTHKDTKKTAKLKSENYVTRTQDAVCSFINPFDAEVKDNLVVLSSGATVPDDIAKDILDAEKSGKEARDKFINDRLEKNKDFYEPIKKINLKTFKDMNMKMKVTAKENKVIQYREQSNKALYLRVQSQKQWV